jgi:short-subunit dehydrogenase
MSTKGTALITGASTGIGALYADRLAKRGYDLILVARNLEKLNELAARLAKETGVKAEAVKADLTDAKDLAAVEKRLADDKTITLLVNNAGMSIPGGTLGSTMDKIDQLLSLNVVAPTHLAKTAAQAFAARKNGAIINLASITALLPEQFPGAYGSTKSYMVHYSQALAAELAPHGVKVQAVLPGATRTEIWERAGKNIDDLPAEMVMEVDEMVDASLSGFDKNELITIPSLSDPGQWAALDAARLALGPNLSLKHAAARYKA